MSGAQTVFEFRGVSVSYGERQVLDGFDLKVERGEKALAYGKSGIGKSTLLRLLLGFALPDAGTVLFEGRPLDPPAAWEARRRVAYVGQDLDVAGGPVREFLDRSLGYRANAHRRPGPREVAETLESLELEPGVVEKDLADLSGGERQRVALALALLLRRDLFLLDEVTSALDVPMKRKVIEVFAARPEWTVLTVSHDHHWLDDGRMRVVEIGGG
jgi:putative ABC transport system ATP-binding protein